MKNFFTICFAIIFFNSNNAQIPVGKTTLDYEISRGGNTLKMNGSGVRSLAFLDLYSAALYLQNKSKDPIAICYDDSNMSIQLKITSKLISRDKMIRSIQDGFKKSTNGDTVDLKSRINLIEQFYSKNLKKGDIIELAYIRNKGLVCMMNEIELGVIPGQDFKFALYKIWLGENPINKSLKKDLLGV